MVDLWRGFFGISVFLSEKLAVVEEVFKSFSQVEAPVQLSKNTPSQDLLLSINSKSSCSFSDFICSKIV